MRATTHTMCGESAISVLKAPIRIGRNADDQVNAQVFHNAVLRRAKRVDN